MHTIISYVFIFYFFSVFKSNFKLPIHTNFKAKKVAFIFVSFFISKNKVDWSLQILRNRPPFRKLFSLLFCFLCHNNLYEKAKTKKSTSHTFMRMRKETNKKMIIINLPRGRSNVFEGVLTTGNDDRCLPPLLNPVLAVSTSDIIPGSSSKSGPWFTGAYPRTGGGFCFVYIKFLLLYIIHNKSSEKVKYYFNLKKNYIFIINFYYKFLTIQYSLEFRKKLKIERTNSTQPN